MVEAAPSLAWVECALWQTAEMQNLAEAVLSPERKRSPNPRNSVLLTVLEAGVSGNLHLLFPCSWHFVGPVRLQIGPFRS